MLRHVAAVVALAVVLAPASALAQSPQSPQPLPPLPPPPPPSAPSAPVDATSAPPDVTYAGGSSEAPAPYAARPPEYPTPPVPPCGGPGAFTHDGFYLRVSSGIALVALGGTGPTGDASIGGAGSSGGLAIGGTPSRGFVVGGAINGGSIGPNNAKGLPAEVTGGSTGELAAFADWFPNEHRGWHVGGMLGVGFVSITQLHTSTWNGGSLAGNLFGGYDFWLGPEWSLGVQADLGLTGRAKLQDDNQNDTGYRLGGFVGGLEATLLYH
jgi:hypothetical protein